MESSGIEWCPSDVQQEVFFTREAFEKYSLRNKLEKVIREKEEELFPEGRTFKPLVHEELILQESIDIRISPGSAHEDETRKAHNQDVTDPSEKSEDATHEPARKNECLSTCEKEFVKAPSVQKEIINPSTGTGKSHIWVLPGKEPEEELLSKPQVKMIINERPGSWYSKLPYPRPSWLTMEEQRLYVEFLLKKQKGRPNISDAKDMQRFKEIQQKVMAEQEEFHVYSEENAIRYPEKYHTMDQSAEQFIDEYITSLCQRAASYPRYFVQQDSVPISQKIAALIPLMHIKCLLKLGNITKAIIPNIATPTRPRIPGDKERISERYPPLHNNKKPTCSTDANMEKLAIKYAAEVTISASGLKCLLDHGSNFERQWELPVVVKEHVIKDKRGERRHKVVYIDKPFPQRSMLATTKNAWFYKFATKSFILHPNHPAGKTFSSHKRETIASTEPMVEEEDEETFQDLADLETFGTVSSVSSAFKKYVREPKKETIPKVQVEGNVDDGAGDQCETDSSKGVVLHRSGSEGFSVNQGATCGDLLNAVRSPVGSPQPETKMKTNPIQVDTKDPENTKILPGKKDLTEGSLRQVEVPDKNKQGGEEMEVDTSPVQPVLKLEKKETVAILVNNECLDKTLDPQEKGAIDSKSEMNQDASCPPAVREGSEHKRESNSTDSSSENKKGKAESPHDPLLDRSISSHDEALKIVAESEDMISDQEKNKGTHNEQPKRRTRSSSGQVKDGIDSSSGSQKSSESMTQKQKADVMPKTSTDEDSDGERLVIDDPDDSLEIETSMGASERRPRTRSISKSEPEPEPPKRGRGRPRKIKVENTSPEGEVNKGGAGPKRVTRRTSSSEESCLGKRRSARLASHDMMADVEGTETKRKKSLDTPSSPEWETDKTKSVDGNTYLSIPTSFSYQDVPSQLHPDIGYSGPKIIPLSPQPRPKGAVSCKQELFDKSPPAATSEEGIITEQMEECDAKAVNQNLKDSVTKPPRVSRPPPDKIPSTLDQILAAQKEFLTPGTPAVYEEQPPVPEANPPEKSKSMESDPNGWIPSEDPQHYDIYAQPNLTYNLWLLGNTRLLIRCGIHGVHKASKKKFTNEISLSAKMEHQPFFGIEQATYSDYARAWVDTYIRNVQKLARVRINAYNSEIVYIEHLGIGDIINAKSPFNPLTAMSMVNGILEKLKSLPEGHYLLGHSPGNLHAHIKKSVITTRGVYDLHKAYLDRKVGLINNVRIPWAPTDTTTLLFYHKKHMRVPATFEPKDSRNVASMTAGHGANKPHKKKNKGKKKKKKKN